MPLWIVATPIGTIGDLSPRARRVLASADVILCEDTRRTRRLLGACEIPAPPLLALHAHNEARQAGALADRCNHESVVLVSDAGTPAVSDPGGRLVEACHQRGVPLLSVPGPSALTTALAASGFPMVPATFMGFAPRKGLENWARTLASRPETMVIYEAPSRVASTMARLAHQMPHREAVLCRELSKQHEEVLRDQLPALAVSLEARESIRGECVVVIGPGEPVQDKGPDLTEVRGLKAIAAALAGQWQVPKKEVYRRLLDIKADFEP
ncbi:MAG: 16S rRNA (cytidine(1402)-2'-O)-methyltransferase [Myxococcota bacterium]